MMINAGIYDAVNVITARLARFLIFYALIILNAGLVNSQILSLCNHLTALLVSFLKSTDISLL